MATALFEYSYRASLRQGLSKALVIICRGDHWSSAKDTKNFVKTKIKNTHSERGAYFVLSLAKRRCFYVPFLGSFLFRRAVPWCRRFPPKAPQNRSDLANFLSRIFATGRCPVFFHYFSWFLYRKKKSNQKKKEPLVEIPHPIPY